MHMQRDNEGIRLPKLLGLAVAGATLLAGMVVLPATHASAADTYGYNAEDDFKPGPLQDTVVPKLTVTKYLSLSNGYSPTGSSTDLEKLKTDNDLVPAKDITFNVKEVKPADGKQLSDIKANDKNSYQVVKTYGGVTNGQGVIEKWYPADDATGAIASGATEAQFPSGGVHWYVLVENRDQSYAFNASNPNKLDSNKYEDAAPSFFGLPYAATSLNSTDTASKVQGYIYHLHLYPKNVNNTEFSKTVQGISDSQGNPKDQRTAVAGDKITYKLSQKLYNAGADYDATNYPHDGKLDLKEITGTGPHLRIVDRMSSSLKLDGNFTVTLQPDDSATGITLDNTSYDYTTPTVNPKGLVQTSKDMLPAVASQLVKYYQFDFFKSTSSLSDITAKTLHLNITYTALVTADGDSTGTDGVANDAAADFIDNYAAGKPADPIQEHTNVINGVLAFASVKNKASGYAALPGTEYRLVASTSSLDKYLASDGKFYSTDATLPANVQLYKATANDNGVVAFAALPIFGDSGTGTRAGEKTVQAGNWVLVETKTPDDWRNPGIPFGTVTYKDAGQTESQIAATYGPHATVEPKYDALNFGNFNVDPSEIADTSNMKFNNVLVSRFLKHYATTDGDSPLGLPLTGGRGILLLLVVGALIMGGALYARNRRNNAARA